MSAKVYRSKPGSGRAPGAAIHKTTWRGCDLEIHRSARGTYAAWLYPKSGRGKPLPISIGKARSLVDAEKKARAFLNRVHAA